MPVFKNKTQGKYVNVSKGILENRNLTLRDRGLLVTLLSLPDNWDFSIAGLTKILPDGKSSVGAGLDHLTELGYLTRTQERTANGKFGMNVIEVHETPRSPLAENPSSVNRSTVNSTTGKPVAEKRSQVSNKEVTIYKVNNNKVNNQESETLSDTDYKELVLRFGKENVNYQIQKIQKKHYKGCMNKNTISQWCEEFQDKIKPPKKKNGFNNFPQREYDYDELERMLLNNPVHGMEGGIVDVG